MARRSLKRIESLSVSVEAASKEYTTIRFCVPTSKHDIFVLLLGIYRSGVAPDWMEGREEEDSDEESEEELER